MNNASQLVFIINEFAGNGKGKKRWTILEKQLSIPYTAYFTKYHRNAYEIAKELADKALADEQLHVVIVVGGDGTMHEVINGCTTNKYVLVGNLKAGSGNDFARGYTSFETGREIENFVKTKNYIEIVDCGLVHLLYEQHFFINNCGVGFDAFVGFAANNSSVKKLLNKINLGKLSYIYYTLIGLFQFKPFDLTVSTKDETTQFKNVWFATVSNQMYFGGGMKISPKSIVNDGLLELTIVHNLSKIKFLSLFITVFFGAHTRFKEVKQLSKEHFELLIDEQLPYHRDGEAFIVESGKLHFSVKKNALQIAKKARNKSKT